MKKNKPMTKKEELLFMLATFPVGCAIMTLSLFWGAY